MHNNVINENNFFLVEASKLSFEDTFMNYEPRDEFERNLKRDLRYVITSKMEDFYCSRNSPILSDSDSEIIAFGNFDGEYHKTYRFWNRVSKRISKEKKSRIGTRYQHSAYLGTVMKQLINCGMSVERVWKEIHNIKKLYYLSKELPQYQHINISFYGKKDKLLRDDRGLFQRIRIFIQIGTFKEGYYLFSDEEYGYYNLYKYWIGETYCVPWIICN